MVTLTRLYGRDTFAALFWAMMLEGKQTVLTREFVMKPMFRSLIFSVALLLMPLPAQGQAGEDTAVEKAVDASAIRVVQQRPVIKSGRFELQVLGELSIADVMFRHYSAGGNAYFHLSEEWAIGASYRHHFAEESTLLKDVTDKFEVFPERSIMRWSAVAEAAWTPIYGKLAFFDDDIVHFDMHLVVGGGVTQTSRSSTPRVTGLVGFGGRLLVSSWFSVNMEIRDQIYVETYNEGGQLVNNVGLSFGFSVFFPFDHEYRYPK